MKNLLSILILIFALNIANAQIGINTTDPDPNAVLHIFSLDKGILIPRMPSNNRAPENYPNPPNGVIVYDTTLKKFFVWRKHMGGIEKSGKWEYINPWTVNDTYHKMSLSTSVASEVVIEGDLFLNNNVTLSKLSAGKVIETDENKKLIAVSKKSAYNKSFGAGNSNVARGNHTHSSYNGTVDLGGNTQMQIVNGVIQSVSSYGPTSGKIWGEVNYNYENNDPIDQTCLVTIIYIKGENGAPNCTLKRVSCDNCDVYGTTIYTDEYPADMMLTEISLGEGPSIVHITYNDQQKSSKGVATATFNLLEGDGSSNNILDVITVKLMTGQRLQK